MKSPLIAALSAGAALSLMAAGATFAQAPAPEAPRAAHMKRQHDPAEHAQRLRDSLQLTPAQEPALQAFIAAHGDRGGDPQARRAEHEAMAKLSTPERLDRMAARMAEHQQRMTAHIAATKRFYAALTPSQQKAFDAMHKGGKHKRMMKRHMGGMMGRHGG
jgi:protein CpxP